MIWYFLLGVIINSIAIKILEGEVTIKDFILILVCGFFWPIIFVLLLIFHDVLGSKFFNKKIF